MEQNENVHETTDVLVVGAGLAGLAAARLVAGRGPRVTVVDPTVPGGRGRTDVVDGFRFNRGAHALYLGGRAKAVLDQLGVPLAGGAPTTNMFGRRGELVGRLPADARTLMTTTLLGWRGRLGVGRVLGGIKRWKPRELAGVSVAEWVDGMHLPADAADLLLALVRVSSYGHAPQVMSADLAAEQIQLALGAGVRYLDGGWQSMVDSLAAPLDVRRAAVTAIGRDGADVVATFADGSTVAASSVIVATGTPAAAAALLGRVAFECGPEIEASCLSLGLRRPAPSPFVLGIDTPLYLSTHHPPAQLAPPGHVVVEVLRYLGPGEHLGVAEARAELHDHRRRAGIDDDDIVTSRALQRMTVCGALATVEHGGMPGRIDVTGAGIDGVLLAGDWVGGEGHLLDAALASAARAAQLATRRVAAAA